MIDQQTSSCPSAEAIRQYAVGGFDDRQSEQLETHLLACPQCETMLDALDDPSDAVIQALTALPLTVDDEEGYQSLRARTLTAPQTFANGASAANLLQQTSRLADPKLGPLPHTLGNYELNVCIGRGASGAVYRARHLKLDQIVAVKVLDESRSLAAEAFLQEMRTIGSLVHPNIVRATDAGEADGLHFLVMEYVEGIDAARVLFRNGPLRVADACEIVRQAGLGLQLIHERALVHRDIKPSNLLVTAGGQVKILDLGIAASDKQPTAESRPQGTLDYMPPEQWQTEATATAQSDIYSLGVTLFKLLTGSLPGKAPRKDGKLCDDLPRAIDKLLNAMLAPSACDRPSTIVKVVDSLSPHTKGANLQALVAATCPSLTTPAPAHSLPTQAPTRRSAMQAIAACGAAALFLSRWRSGTEPQLRRDDWRALAPVSPTLWFSLDNAEDVRFEQAADGSIELSSEAVALLHFGRPVSGMFQLEVSLQTDSRQHSGIFFRGRADFSGDFPVLQFQTIEVFSNPSDDSGVSAQPSLTWNHWKIIKTDSQPMVEKVALAEVSTDLVTKTMGQHLQVTCGRQGMPEVTWNGSRLHESMWQLSAEARTLQRMSAAQLPTAFLGRLGLVNFQNSTTFTAPRLAYI